MRFDRCGAPVAAERSESRSPDCRFGAPHRLTLAALTLKRAAATPWFNPSSRTAATAGCRKSNDSAFDIPVGRPIRQKA